MATDKQTAKLLKASATAANELNLSMEARLKIEKRILDGKLKTLAAVRQESDALLIVDARYQKLVKYQDTILSKKEKLKKLDQQILDLGSDLEDQAKKNVNALSMVGGSNKNNLDASKKIVEQKQKELDTLKASGKGNKQAIQRAEAYLTQLRGSNDAIEAINNKAPYLAEAMGEAGDLAKDVQGKIDGFFKNIPGGGVLKKALGLDQVQKQLTGGINAGLSAMGTALKAGVGPIGALRAGMTAFNATVLLNPVILVVAAIVAAYMAMKKLVSFALEHEKAARGIAEAQGVSVTQGRILQNQAGAAANSFGNQLLRAKDILDVQKEISDELGNSSMVSADIAAQVGDTAKSFGYSTQQAGKLQAQFMNMGMSSENAAVAQRELAAETIKAGVNTGKVVADIAQNAKATTKFFGGNVKALQKAAIEANKLGMSIADMAKISDSLLSFEDSISAQFEFQALSGRQINLDKARQLALEGDIAGATKEVIKNAGSLDDFNKLGVLEKQALAKASGMEVDQLQKSLAISKLMPKATEEQLKAMNALGLSAEQVQNMSADELKQKLAQAQAGEKMSVQMDNLKAQMMKSLLPLGEAFMQIFAALSPLLKILGYQFKFIGFVVKGIAKIINFLIIEPLQYVMDLIESAGSFLQKFMGGGTAPTPVQVQGVPGSLEGMESGGTVTNSGAFVVGEAGPEIVNLEGGSSVISNDQAFGNSGTGANSNNGGSVGIDYQRMAQAIVKAMAGVTVRSAPIQIGAQVINAISDQIDVNKSYT